MSVLAASRHGTSTPQITYRQPHEARDLLGTLVLYRYVSWLLTSTFYLAEPRSNDVMTFKLGVVIALLIASRITTKSYQGLGDNSHGRMVLIALEAVGIALLLIPTGGLKSPFMWYALNPIFLSTREKSPYHCWVVLGGFLVAASCGTAAIAPDNLWAILIEQRGVVLVYLLLTVAARLLTQLVNRLEDAFASSQNLLNHISSLYQALEDCSSGDDPNGLARVLATFAAKLTGSSVGLCYLALDPNTPITEVYDPDNLMQACDLRPAVGLALQGAFASTLSESETYIIEQDMMFIPVTSSSLRYGLLGFRSSPASKLIRVSRSMRFLAELGAISLERWQADRLAARLMVIEEQNRIANEIHDGVSQHLFGMVCSLHSLSQQQACSPIKSQIEALMRTARSASSELRASIYGLSSAKRGEQLFVTSVRAYLSDVSELNGVQTNVNVEGSEDSISPAVRQSLYRIIKEATGNAIRHGCCHTINVHLCMYPDRMLLVIQDDGKGFDINRMVNQGLGLNNMRSLMAGLGGDCLVTSQVGVGTTVTCCIPRQSHCVV